MYELYQAKSYPGMHNIRPAGQMLPAETCNLARKTQNFAYSLIKNTL